MNLKQIASKILAALKLKKIKKEDCVVKNTNICFFDIPKSMFLVIKKYDWVVFFYKTINYLELFFQKYRNKFKNLYSETKRLFRQEGFRKISLRIFNYIFYGKGVLNRKEIKEKNVKTTNQEFFEFIFQQNINPSKEYVVYRNYEKINTNIKLIAFYLPQFHPIPENDKWWGKGFTEWTNVSKAVPQFIGHYQPRLPGELGFYDLRIIDVQRRQIELAKNYGLYGFCYHYYWFGGKRLLEKPLENVLKNPDLDFPFCINWANENWTRRWDGLDNEILICQKHSPDDDIAFIKEVAKLFEDKRYIRVNGKPLLMVYKPTLLPNALETTNRWRTYCRENRIGEIYLIVAHTFGYKDNPGKIGFDAAVEFPPHNYNFLNITSKIEILNKKYAGGVCDYRDMLKSSNKYKLPKFKKFRCLCTGWDNEARKPGKGFTFINAKPSYYKAWLENICYFTKNSFKEDERFIFINAWNEWAEGTYLEPDRKYGYAFLEETYNVLKKFDREKENKILASQKIVKKNNVAVILHLYYLELWNEIKSYLSNIRNFDLYISVNNEISIEMIKKIQYDYPNTRFFSYENKGRDIYPFLKIFEKIEPLNYLCVCKIHSKKSLHLEDGDAWRRQILNDLIGSEAKVKYFISQFKIRNDLGMMLPQSFLVNYNDFVGYNDNIVKDVLDKLNITKPKNFKFPAGSMFWFRPKALKLLLKANFQSSDFSIEMGRKDGELMHAIERIFCLIVKNSGFQVKTFESLSIIPIEYKKQIKNLTEDQIEKIS